MSFLSRTLTHPNLTDYLLPITGTLLLLGMAYLLAPQLMNDWFLMILGHINFFFSGQSS